MNAAAKMIEEPKPLIDCSECRDPIAWHYKNGCSRPECKCKRNFGSQIDKPEEWIQ